MKLQNLPLFLTLLIISNNAFPEINDNAQSDSPQTAQIAQSPLPSVSAKTPEMIKLEPGELRSVRVGEDITRIAIANPDIIDVTIIAPDEILIKAKASGNTDLIFWDNQGQSVSKVEVADTMIETHLNNLFSELNLKNIQLKRENSKLFLVGHLDRESDMTHLQQLLSAYGNQVTNLVTVETPPVPPPPPTPPGKSVALTVQLIEMSRDAKDELGVDWHSSIEHMSFTETPFVRSGPSGGLVQGLSSLAESFRLGSFDRSALTGQLNMLHKHGKARLLAEPRLIAGSGKEAKATMGVQIPIVTGSSVSNGVVTTSVEFKQTGIEMTFKPTILQDEKSVQLAVTSKVSTIDESVKTSIQGVLVPGFRVRESQTEVVTEVGQTLLIAGLLQDEESKALSQVPAIGSIPVFGNLFRSTDFVNRQTELVIVVGIDILGTEAETVDRTFALEQALTNAELARSTQDPTIRYVLGIQEKIAKAIRFPKQEKQLMRESQVKLRLRVSRDGTLKEAKVSESSGFESFDAEALKAAQSQAPYPPFSRELIQQELALELPVIFHP